MQHRQAQNLVNTENFGLLNEDKLFEIMSDPVGQDLLWRVLNREFRDAQSEKIVSHWWGAYRAYTELSWARFRAMRSDFVVETVFGKQLVMAIIIGNDPINELLWYLRLNFTYDKDGAIVEYSRIRDAVFNSQMKVGVWKNQPQTVQSIVQEITRLNQMKNPSFEVAEFKAKLETIFFSEMPDPAYIDRLDIDKRESVVTFFSFIHFLIGVKPEYVFGLVDLPLPSNTLEIEDSDFQSADTIQNTKMDRVVEQDQEPEQEINTNYFVEIKNKIQDDLSSGNIEDETEVFDRLQDYSEEYNDPRILDLYYYDEKLEKFVWNDELLNEE